MTRRVSLLLATLFCLPLSLSRGAEPALKYRLEAELRKEGNPRTVAADVFFEKPARLYYATPDHKSLAITDGTAPVNVKDPQRPKWVRRFELPVRAPDAKDFDKDTPKVVVEVFRDAITDRLLYVSESGSLAVLPEPPAGKAKNVAPPRWLYRMQLRVRPSGENDFTRDSIKVNVEVYLHEPTGHLLYVGHSGAIAAVETKKDFRDFKEQRPRWSHALDLKARKPDQKDFDTNTPKVAMEVFADDNADVMLYATDAMTLAAVPGVVREIRVFKPAHWSHDLHSGKFAAEVFANPNAGHTVVVTHAGAIAVALGEPPAAEPTKANGAGFAVIGVLGTSGKVTFMPAGSGVEAVALPGGKLQWFAADTGDPLLATTDHVFAQAEVKGKKNQVKLFVIDATTGKRVRESDAITFPEWVSVPHDYGHSFRSGMRLERGEVVYVWEARTFQDGGPPPRDPDPNAKFAGGAVRLDVKTGRVTTIKDYKPKETDFPVIQSTETKVAGWNYHVEFLPNNASMPRQPLSRVLIATGPDGKEAWRRPVASVPFLPPRP